MNRWIPVWGSDRFHQSDWMNSEFFRNLNRSQHSGMSLVLFFFHTYFKLYLELVIYYFVDYFKRYLLIKRRALITSKDWEKSWKYWEIHYAWETGYMGIDACRLYVVFSHVGKKPTDDDQQNTLFSFLLSNIYSASKDCCSTMLCAKTSIFGEREQKQARQSAFFLLSLADSFSKRDILYCNKFEENVQIYAKIHEKVVKWLVIQNFEKAEHIWTVYLELKVFHNVVMIKLIYFLGWGWGWGLIQSRRLQSRFGLQSLEVVHQVVKRICIVENQSKASEIQ